MSEQLVDYEVYANEFETKKAEAAVIRLQLSNGGLNEHVEKDQEPERPARTLEEAIERGLPTYTITRANGSYYTLSVQKVLNDRKRRNKQHNRMWERPIPREQYFQNDPRDPRSHWHQVADQYKDSMLKTQRELIDSRREAAEMREKITKLEKSCAYYEKQSDNWHRTNDKNVEYIEELKKENDELKNKYNTMNAKTSTMMYNMEQLKKSINKFLEE